MVTKLYQLESLDDLNFITIPVKSKATTYEGLFRSSCKAFVKDSSLPDGRYILYNLNGNRIMTMLLRHNDFKMIIDYECALIDCLI